MIDGEAQDLHDLRDAVNNTRSVLRGLQNQARAASRLAADLEERLEIYDDLLRQRQALEAQHEYETKDRQPVRHH